MLNRGHPPSDGPGLLKTDWMDQEYDDLEGA